MDRIVNAPLHQIIGSPGWTPAYTFTLPTATGGAGVEVMVVGWTGPYPDWNSAYMALGELIGNWFLRARLYSALRG